MPNLILGVDAGGTKTHAAVMDLDGHILGFGIAGSGNWERVGLLESGGAIKNAIDCALAQAGALITDVVSATLALAGVDWQRDADVMHTMVSTFGFKCTPNIINDAYAVLYAGTSDGIGVASIAGTGGKTIGRDGHRDVATLGMSLGEGGGAGQLISEGLRIVAEMHHGQRTVSTLLERVVAAAGQPDALSFFQSIARDGLTLGEEHAPLFFTLADAGDAAAIEAVESVAVQHANDVLGVTNLLNFNGSPVHLVRAGGLHTAGSSVFDNAFDQELERAGVNTTSTVLGVVPVIGSLVHAAIDSNFGFGSEKVERLHADALARSDEFRAVERKVS